MSSYIRPDSAISSFSANWQQKLAHRLLFAALSGMAIGSMAGHSHAAAAEMAPAVKYHDIQAGSLEAVLSAFAAANDVALSFDPALVAGKQSIGLKGRYGLQQGFDEILKGTGLGISVKGTAGYTLVKTEILRKSGAPATDSTLPEVSVQGKKFNQSLATTEGTGSYASNIVTIGKGEQKQRDIPQAVSVITQQRIQDQGIQDIRQALANAPGVSMISNEPGGQAYSRGFFIQSYQFNGVPLERQLYARGSAFNSDMAIFDRVEIMRGPQGLFEGAGDPSGSINLVRKRPTYDQQIVLTAKAGSWDQYGTQADIAGPLNESGTVRGRFVAHYRAADSFRDDVDSNERTLYGALDIDLGPDTVLGIGISREKPRAGGLDWKGLPNYADGTMPDYKRSTNLAASWGYARKTQDTYYLDLQHRFNDNWKFKASLVRVNEENEIKYLLRSGRLGPPNTVRGNVYYFDMESRNLGADAHITGNTEIFGRKLDVTAGANFSRQSSSDLWGWKSNVESLDSRYDQLVTIPQPSNGEIFAANRMDDGYESNKKGIYTMLRYAITEPLSIMVGGRLSSFKQTYSSDGSWGISETTAEKNNEFTPFAALSYKLDGAWSLHGSYAEIFNPQSQRGVTGQFLQPITGKNYELGLKGELLGGRVNTALALFRTEQENIGFEDLSIPQAIADTRCGGTCYRASSNVISKGLEAEVSGEVLRGLQLSAAYTLTKTEYLGDDIPSVGYNISVNSGVPRQMLRVWSNYRLPGEWNKLSVGAGVNAQSRASDFAYDNRSQGGYTLINARVAYELSQRLTAALNVDNLTDKHYFSSISYGSNFYGVPRSVMLTVQYRM